MENLPARLAEILASRLGSETFTLYLYGSAVLGDFRPGWSDLDILCLTAGPLSPDTADRLVLLRQTLAEEEQEPGFRLFEGGITPFAAFLDGLPALSVYWGTSGQRLTDTYSLNPFSLRSLLDDGLLLHGDDIRPRLRPPSRDELRDAVASHLRTVRAYGVQPGRSIHGAGWMLDIARGLYTLRTGRILSKTAAGEWALREGLAPDPPALERVLAIRREPLRYRNDPGALDFIASLGPAVAAFAAVLEATLSGSAPH